MNFKKLSLILTGLVGAVKADTSVRRLGHKLPHPTAFDETNNDENNHSNLRRELESGGQPGISHVDPALLGKCDDELQHAPRLKAFCYAYHSQDCASNACNNIFKQSCTQIIENYKKRRESDDPLFIPGTVDCNDLCPEDPYKTNPGICGCGVPDTDSDGDGVVDCIDLCPDDPYKTQPGDCGCGVPDTDSDGDGVADCNDRCPGDPNKSAPGVCGCGVPDTDSDGDGAADCIDGCPDDPNKAAPGVCGCGVEDIDTDGDGIADCIDDPPDSCTGGTYAIPDPCSDLQDGDSCLLFPIEDSGIGQCYGGLCHVVAFDGFTSCSGNVPDNTHCVTGEDGLLGVCIGTVCMETSCGAASTSCDHHNPGICLDGKCYVENFCIHNGIPDGTACVDGAYTEGICIGGECTTNLPVTCDPSSGIACWQCNEPGVNHLDPCDAGGGLNGHCVSGFCNVYCVGKIEGDSCMNQGQPGQCDAYGDCILDDCVSIQSDGSVGNLAGFESCNGGQDSSGDVIPGKCIHRHCNVYCIGKTNGEPCAYQGVPGTCGSSDAIPGELSDGLCYVNSCFNADTNGNVQHNHPCDEGNGPGRCFFAQCQTYCESV